MKHITKLETDFIWKLLLHRPTELTESADQSTLCTELTESADQSTLCTFIIFQLECVSIMLEGGRHTYLIEADTVCGVLCGIMEEQFDNKEVGLLNYLFKFSSTISILFLLDHHFNFLISSPPLLISQLYLFFNPPQICFSLIPSSQICSLLTSSTLSFVSANNHLMRYLGQPSVCDAALLTKYFNSTQDVKQVNY